MDILLGLLASGVVLASLPGTLELLLLTLGGLLYRRPGLNTPPSDASLAVIVPAHNERLHIERCVRSLQASAKGLSAQIVVIADNCEDDTADLAASAGARVLVRNDDAQRGKGFALDFAFQTLLPEGFQAFVVIDADSVVSENLLSEIAAHLADGAEAVQARYTTLNVDASLRTRLMNLALMAFNVLRPRGRDALGLSAGILGNGFALSAETLRAVPYGAASVVEDLEYHLLLVQAQRRVRFVDRAWVKADMPTGGRGSRTQRARWEGGRLRMIKTHVPSLLRRMISGRWRLFEPALDLLLLPLSLHLVLLLVALGLPVDWSRTYALFGLAVVALHVLAAVRVGGGTWRDLAAIAIAPFYVVWKLTLLPAIGRAGGSRAAWVRTDREPEDSSRNE
jgi:cellulose synthase/poly-beta-1,6-N-acetylglucosamine synthase-like glycosyltransferase